MRLEHIALQVAEPARMAAWYCEHLGMKVVDQVGDACFFIVDEGGAMLEIYHSPAEGVPDYAAKTPLELHVAFWTDDVPGDCARLASAGATIVRPPDDPSADFQQAMLRDPWGLVVQLIKRAKRLN
ncbi:hypothetical protein LCGC14_0312460 [marine sediment metagenome]|uniref:VOC domain-containing protein n=1 Tax=marine sediment metagenome TaxID=412755 RepID=A0A0F9TS13_9ZZZZ|nr:VOC family protein [Phycisphaerae bacterium]HDZ44810.1 VOC family protein [Phycisphaerae bacterium]